MDARAFVDDGGRVTIYVRVIDGIVEHFPARRSEWALAAMMATVGALLLDPAVTFTPGVMLFQTLSAVATENEWGWACLGFGGARLIALFINGSFANSYWSRWSPHIRGAFAFLSCFFWLTITFGLLVSFKPYFALGIYPYLLLLDLSNVSQAFHDAGEADQAWRRRNGR